MVCVWRSKTGGRYDDCTGSIDGRLRGIGNAVHPQYPCGAFSAQTA